MKRIAVSAPVLSLGHQRMFASLGEILNVRFEEWKTGDDKEVDASVFFNVNQESLARIQNNKRPSYIIICEDHLISCGESPTIKFTKEHGSPSLLMGRELWSDEAIRLKGLPQWLLNVTTLASKEDTPFWAVQRMPGQQHHYVSLPIPELGEDEPLYQYFHGNQFLGLLPFLTFLRELTDDWRWKPPPLHACFMFDDPNLHWPTYGYINFLEIVKQAIRDNYHVSFATIPLDGWLIHGATAELFRKHRDKISLLIHGNDHICEELAIRIPSEERSRILKQALYRINKLENRSGIEVAKIMAPPHGACSEDTLAEMAQLGYEAACISRGSLRHYNSQAKWIRTLGMRPSVIIDGLPVFPRFRMSGSCQNSILVAALLRQPIIPVGHHQDVADGLGILTDLSRFINSFGNVKWADMTTISRSQYSHMIEGNTLHLKMHSNLVEVLIPDDIHHILIHRPPVDNWVYEPLLLNIISKGINIKRKNFQEPIAVQPGQQVKIITYEPLKSPDRYQFQGKLKPWPVIRRLITEIRDRFAPIMRHF